MVTLVTDFRVRDYDAWKPVFDEQEPLRRSHGGIEHRVYRDVHDRSHVVVHNDFPSAEDARSFLEDLSLKQAMERGGVEASPAAMFLERAGD
jgi:hypothetical protein